MTLKLLVDDGAAVFLNGSPILYFGLATNATYRTLATTQSGSLEDTWFSLPVDPLKLTNGVNTLAVEVHQASASSADLSFDLQLIATLEMSAVIPPKLNLTRLGNAQKVCWPAAAGGYVLEETDVLGPANLWIPAQETVQFFNDGFFVTNAAPTKFFRLRAGTTQ